MGGMGGNAVWGWLKVAHHYADGVSVCACVYGRAGVGVCLVVGMAGSEEGRVGGRRLGEGEGVMEGFTIAAAV